MSTIQYALLSTFAAKYRAQYPVYAMPSLMPVKSNIITFLDTQSTIFNLTYLFRYWSYVDNSMRGILHICFQIQSTISGLRYVKSGPNQIQYNYICWYSGVNIQLNVSPSILVICRQFNERYTPHYLSNTGHISQFALRQLWGSVELNVLTDLHIESSVINWTYFRCYYRYVDNSVLRYTPPLQPHAA
jgi:hypothetical protein